MSIRSVFLALVFAIGFIQCDGQTAPQRPAHKTADPNADPLAVDKAGQHWVDSILSRLTTDQKIGQLMMVPAYSGGPNFNQDSIEKLLRARQLGGIIFMQGGAVRQARLTERYQQLANVPLLIAMDAEWGLGMRLDSIKNLPRQMIVGATRDTAMAYMLGAAVAYQCRLMGVHIDFAPVVDVNNNPGNPVINSRSFGENKEWVARLAVAYMRGLQDAGVMACAKHFPGHGDTETDSHLDLPVVDKTRAQLDDLELYPFAELKKAGVQSMMVAHLQIPSLERETHVPTTLSRNTVTTLLKEELGFRGLIFTDALNMQGVAKYFPGGEGAYRAYTAGADILLFPQDVPAAISRIKAWVGSDRGRTDDLNARVKKVLAAKYRAGLSVPREPISTWNLAYALNHYTLDLGTRIAEDGLTLVRDDNKVLGMKGTGRKLYIITNGDAPAGLEKGLDSTGWEVRKMTTPGSFRAADYDKVVIGIHGSKLTPANKYGITEATLAYIKANTAAAKNVIVAHMGNPYAMRYIGNVPSLLVGYEDTEWTAAALLRILNGEITPKGILPVTPASGT